MLGRLFKKDERRVRQVMSNLPAEVYFLGFGSSLFKLFAPAIWTALGGGVTGVVSDEVRRDFGSVAFAEGNVPILSLAELLVRAQDRKVKIVHFLENLDQYWGLAHLVHTHQLVVTDFLALLHALDLPHTYQTMRAETEYARQASAEYLWIRQHLSDELSSRTLDARIEALTMLDRKPLLEVRLPVKHEYFNEGDPRASLLLASDEIYIDIGAANGDTVTRFRAAVSDRFVGIHAFEPTPGQYRELAQHQLDDSRIKTYRNAVGDVSGPITFFDNPDNPFGSNALAPSSLLPGIEVQCVRLDEVIEHCTLIKMDVEGFECNVLRGAERLIRESRPNLAVTCYHYPRDMCEILKQVLAIHSYQSVALRHYGTSLYDTVLLFSDRQKF